MYPARCRAYRLSNVFEKSDDVVVGSLFDFQNLRNRKSRSFPNFGSVVLWNLAKVRHRLTREYFNFQPDLEFALVRPDFAHLWPGITVDHRIKIKATALREKCFVDHAVFQRNGCQRENKDSAEESGLYSVARNRGRLA